MSTDTTEGTEGQATKSPKKVRVGRCDLFIWGIGEDPDVVGYFSDEAETYVGRIKKDGSLLFTCGKEKTVLTFGGLRATSLGAAAVCPPNRKDAKLPAGVCSLLVGWYEPIAAGNRGYFSDVAGSYTAFVGKDDKVLFWGTGLKAEGETISQLAELYELALKARQKDQHDAQGKVGQWVCSWQEGAQQSTDGDHMEHVAASLRASADRLERDAALQVMLAGKLITEQRAKEAEAEGWSLAVLAKYAEEVSHQNGHASQVGGAVVTWSKYQIHGAVDAIVDLGKMPAETAPHAKGWSCFQLRDYVLGQRWAREADLNALIRMGKTP